MLAIKILQPRLLLIMDLIKFKVRIIREGMMVKHLNQNRDKKLVDLGKNSLSIYLDKAMINLRTDRLNCKSLK